MWFSVPFVFASWILMMLCPATVEDRGRELQFPAHYFFAERRLMNHTIRAMHVKDLDDCEFLCYRDDNCVSLNIKNKDPDSGTHECELNNSTHMEHEEDLTSNPKFYYRGAKNACGKNGRKCGNNGICQAGFTDKGYRCLCDAGFRGEHCEEVKDECSSNSQSCDVNAVCSNAKGSYPCICKAGYSGDGATCSDIDECSTKSHGCDVNAVCSNTPASYTCACKAGHSGDGRSCNDIDECSSSSHGCDVNAVCSNTHGSHTCACKAGYSGDGITCRDIDECSSDSHSCDVNAVCSNTHGSYTCACKAGYSGDGRSCNDLDKCSSDSHGCDVNAVCSNTHGSYTCACKAGYSGDGISCSDIDECVSGIQDCHSTALCTNTVGSYSCSCTNPLTGDGRTCWHSSSECENYGSLEDGNRKTSYSGNDGHCDDQLGPGWFRFQGAAGTRMPTSCPPRRVCGTEAPGWLDGAHPTVAEGGVTRKVCFRRGQNCCKRSINIQVRHCSSFYVYRFNGTADGRCNLRYCGTD